MPSVTLDTSEVEALRRADAAELPSRSHAWMVDRLERYGVQRWPDGAINLGGIRCGLMHHHAGEDVRHGFDAAGGLLPVGGCAMIDGRPVRRFRDVDDAARALAQAAYRAAATPEAPAGDLAGFRSVHPTPDEIANEGRFMSPWRSETGAAKPKPKPPKIKPKAIKPKLKIGPIAAPATVSAPIAAPVSPAAPLAAPSFEGHIITSADEQQPPRFFAEAAEAWNAVKAAALKVAQQRHAAGEPTISDGGNGGTYTAIVVSPIGDIENAWTGEWWYDAAGWHFTGEGPTDQAPAVGGETEEHQYPVTVFTPEGEEYLGSFPSARNAWQIGKVAALRAAARRRALGKTPFTDPGYHEGTFASFSVLMGIGAAWGGEWWYDAAGWHFTGEEPDAELGAAAGDLAALGSGLLPGGGLLPGTWQWFFGPSADSEEVFRGLTADWQSYERAGVPGSFPELADTHKAWIAFRDDWNAGRADTTNLNPMVSDSNRVRATLFEKTRDPAWNKPARRGLDIEHTTPALTLAADIDQAAKQAGFKPGGDLSSPLGFWRLLPWWGQAAIAGAVGLIVLPPLVSLSTSLATAISTSRQPPQR